MEESWPDPDSAFALYLRLGGNDPVAQADFAAAFLEPLVAFLQMDSPHVDEHARLTAAEDAVLSVLRNPAAYRHSRAPGTGPAPVTPPRRRRKAASP